MLRVVRAVSVAPPALAVQNIKPPGAESRLQSNLVHKLYGGWPQLPKVTAKLPEGALLRQFEPLLLISSASKVALSGRPPLQRSGGKPKVRCELLLNRPAEAAATDAELQMRGVGRGHDVGESAQESLTQRHLVPEASEDGPECVRSRLPAEDPARRVSALEAPREVPDSEVTASTEIVDLALLAGRERNASPHEVVVVKADKGGESLRVSMPRVSGWAAHTPRTDGTVRRAKPSLLRRNGHGGKPRGSDEVVNLRARRGQRSAGAVARGRAAAPQYAPVPDRAAAPDVQQSAHGAEASAAVTVPGGNGAEIRRHAGTVGG
jgi:hypothetical protein